MARLTGYDADGEMIICEEERLLRSKGIITKDEMYKIMRHLAEKLAEYEDLEEQGKLMKFPCSIGDAVYTIHNVKRKGVISKEIWESTVTSFNIERDGDWNISFEHIEPRGLICPNYCKFEHVGGLVFLTKPAAEQAFREMMEKKSNGESN